MITLDNIYQDQHDGVLSFFISLVMYFFEMGTIIIIITAERDYEAQVS